MKRILYILLLGFLANTANGQSLKAFLAAGVEAVEKGDHYNALYYYGEALEFDTTNLDVRYQFGMACKHFNAYRLAEEQFQYVSDQDSDRAYPLSILYLAEMQQRQGKYDNAKMNYALYTSEFSDDSKHFAKAEKEIEAIDWAITQIENPTPGVAVSRLDENVNTPYSEFGAFEKDDRLYYSSLRFEKEKKEHRINRIYAKILSASDSQISQPLEGSINESPEHIAHSAFNADGTRMYYTICAYTENLNINCEIFYRDIIGDNEFGNPVRLPDHINQQGFTSTQPAVGHNYRTGEEVLYFSSNKEGSKDGSMDIWYCEIDGDDYGEAVNIEAINTNEDEMSPFYHSPSSTLYFSSEGYLGLGGFDVFQSYIEDGEYVKAENLGAPVNSSFNDLYYALNEDGDKAHFSSNRTGSLYLEDSYEACCYDIYKADIEEVKISLDILTFNNETKDPLPGVTVKIIDIVTDTVLFESYNPSGHDHAFEITCGREYLIVSEKNGYDSDTTSVTTRQCDETTEITKKVYLTPQIIELEVLTFDKRTLESLTGVNVMLEDLSDTSVEIKRYTNFDANDFHFDITAGHRYRITATKRGYKEETLITETHDVEDGKITRKMYLLHINDYLPITVYFDNDHPNPKTRSMYSDLTYSDTYTPYVARQDEFVTSFTGDMEGEEKSNAENALNAFFNDKVKYGHDRLVNFISILKSRLEAGDIIEITLKGFASPRAANKYNLALGQRRIWTIKNAISNYNNGELAPYIESERLLVTEVSYGEEIAPKNISDSVNNSRLSIYSVEASQERKCEIVRVRILN